MKQCVWCLDSFEPKVSYQIYCSPECRSEATRHNTAEKYRERKVARRKQKERVCKNKECGNVLSIYNDGDYCASCFFSEHIVTKELKRIKGMINGQGNENSERQGTK